MVWDKIERIDSAEGNVCKFVYSHNRAVAESVLYRYPTYQTRTVICCSTQSGCPVGCRFCGAGDYFVKNLTSLEITTQVDHSLKATGVDPSTIKRLQIMFMSMGEPLLNEHGLIPAITYLYEKYPRAALLVSTIGPKIDLEWFNDLSVNIPTIGLQFSVHKSTNSARDELIPFKSKMTLEEIAVAGSRWAYRTGRQPFFNYCAGDDNISDEDADRLLYLFDPILWQCTISVICERNEGLPARNAHQTELALDFSSKMLSRGYNVRVFDPAGQDDIGGGCGQLWFVQRWMQAHPALARPSVGYGKPSVHTPVLANV